MLGGCRYLRTSWGYNFSISLFSNCPVLTASPKTRISRPYPLLPSSLSLLPGIPLRIRPSGILHPPSAP